MILYQGHLISIFTISWLIYSRYKLGLHPSNVLYPPCAAAELHMRLFVNFTLDEIQEMVNKANSGEIDPVYVDYVEVMYVITHVCRT